MAAEPLANVSALLEVPLLVVAGDLTLRVCFGHHRPYPIHSLTPLGAHIGVSEVGPERLHGDAAAGHGELMNTFEQ